MTNSYYFSGPINIPSQKRFGRYTANSLDGQRFRTVPTSKEKTRREVSIGAPRKVSTFVRRVTDLAEKWGCSIDDLSISDRHYRGEMWIYSMLPESDEEFAARVKAAEEFNTALTQFRDYRDEMKKEQEEKRKKEQERIKQEEALLRKKAESALLEEIKDQMRSDAKLILTLSDRLLSDEEFIDALMRLRGKK